ncbi:MAG: hypothetical protein JO127_06500 [Caulobacteraceae bacterium]|nr:hypothetical protein [Caulobacteraceae bacterium]
MAYDAEPGGDPRGPWCKGCKTAIAPGQASTRLHVLQDPDGKLGLTGLWHAECARPYWDTITPMLRRVGWR